MMKIISHLAINSNILLACQRRVVTWKLPLTLTTKALLSFIVYVCLSINISMFI